MHWDGLTGLAERLTGAGFDVAWDDGISGRRRFHTLDPFGNRLEFLDEG